ncbi:MAG: acetate--CoA ligase family protein [Melioribacter sp.]|nr:acetate--CoA ligase family protein [Melioribacter sp.]
MESLEKFFYPKSLCIVGASAKEKSIGYEILKNIKDYGYLGKIFPINPNANKILDFKCYHDVEEVEDKIDLAIVVVPKKAVEESIDKVLKKNIKSIILITAGFKETGINGEELEKKIVNKIKEQNARLIGPNCMGIINTLDNIKLNATFVAEKPEKGNIGFLSQSGALGAAVLNSLRETDIKFAHFISVGNKADVNENDLIEFWQEDENIKTIVFYLESFVDGENFIKKFAIGNIDKPIIILKAGKTQSGIRAASSHTGALSNNDKIVNALLNQFGIIRAENLNELFNTAKGFEHFQMPKGNKVAVVTNAGGPAILCVDKIEKEGLSLAPISKSTKDDIKKIIHPEGCTENPIDLLPAADANTFKNVIEILSNDKNVDAIISIFVEPVMTDAFEVIETINSIKSEKPIFQVAMSLPEFWQKYRKESKYKIPIFKNPEDPPEIISNMFFFTKKKEILNKNLEDYLLMIKKEHTKKFNFKSGYISQNQVNTILKFYNFPIIESKTIKPEDIETIKELEYPLVIKGINRNVIHKTELNAVKLNIKNKYELINKAKEITINFRKNNFEVEEFLIQKYVEPKYEILIGGYRDISFGPTIMFGFGGKYVEVIEDIEIKSCYLSDDDIEELIESTKIGKILKGVRKEDSCNLAELKRIIKTSAIMMIENPEILEFDFNPIIINNQNKLYIVDARMKWN